VDRRQVPYSPFDGVKLFNEANHRKQPRTLSFVEESKILACCDLRLGTLFKVLNDSGLRVGVEALPIKRSNVDFEDGTITVVHSKTAAGRRAVPMTERCKTALLEWCSATNGMSEYVFFNPQKPTTYIRSVKTAWRNALRAAGIAHFPIYNCRHTFATRLAAAGVPDAIIDQLLGHARHDILSFYTATVTEYLRDAISRLENLRRSKENATGTSDAKLLPSRHILKGSILIQ
jgi:integrase